MRDIKKLLKIEKSLMQEITIGEMTMRLLRINGWIYIDKNTKEENKYIIDLLQNNKISYKIINNINKK
jgi:hypothetical protein